MNFDALDYYKLIAYSVQLDEVELYSMKCERYNGDNGKLKISFKRSVKLKSDNEAEIYFKVALDFEEEGPFFIELIYRGFCKSKEEISREQFEEYSYEQVVPLLLPYAREGITNILNRMRLPIYHLPTMDVLQSIEENKTEKDQSDGL